MKTDPGSVHEGPQSTSVGAGRLRTALHLGPSYPEYGGERVYGPTSSVVAITVAHLAGPATAADRALATRVRCVLEKTDAEIVAVFTTHDAENNFPVLPLRDEHVLVWITRFLDDAAYTRHRKRLSGSDDWRDALRRLAARSSQLPLQQLRLRPTAHSQLR